MELAELIALLTGGALALSVWLLGATCVGQGGRRMTAARMLLPAVDTGLLALASAAPATPPVKALAAVSFAVAFLASAIELTSRRADPAWWGSFETAFWRYLEHGGVGDESA